jgi:hypothetical protein
MLLLYIIQGITILLYFPKIYNYTSLYGYGPIASGASVNPTSDLFVHHVDTANCRKLKSMILG